MSFKAIQSFVILSFGAAGLAGCANSSTALDVTRALFGYVEPPKAESVMTALKKEYQRCLSIDENRNCVQLAYDQVREDQGLDPKPIPKGYVIITRDVIESSNDDSENSENANDAN